MNRLLRKFTLVSVFTAGLVLLLSACGGGGSSSGGGGAITGTSSTGATSIVRGNVTGIGGAQVMFIQQMPGSGVERIVKLIADGVISAAHAGTPDVGVCVEGNCTTTDENGDFTLDLSSLEAGTYTMEFTYQGVTYSRGITILENAIITMTNIEISEEFGVVIGDIDVEMIEVEKQEEVETAGNSNIEKVLICHKPGTPAQKTKQVPFPAVRGHMGHGDTEGPCVPLADSGGDPIDADG